MTQNILQGTQVFLRAAEPMDVDIIYRMENDPKVWHYGNTLIPFSKYQIEQYVLNTQHDIFAEKQIRLMIEKVSSANGYPVAGAIDLFDFDPQHKRAGVGILILENERRKGFATEALGLLISYAFKVLELHQLYCNITEDNQSSIDLFEKAGFIRCAIKKEWRLQDKKWIAELTFQLINK